MPIMHQEYMKLPPFDECEQYISTNERAAFRALNQSEAYILTKEIRGLDIDESVNLVHNTMGCTIGKYATDINGIV